MSYLDMENQRRFVFHPPAELEVTDLRRMGATPDIHNHKLLTTGTGVVWLTPLDFSKRWMRIVDVLID